MSSDLHSEQQNHDSRGYETSEYISEVRYMRTVVKIVIHLMKLNEK